MAKTGRHGRLQLKDGNWGYRFKVFVDGKAIYKKCSRMKTAIYFSTNAQP